jgi:hypothetical protein
VNNHSTTDDPEERRAIARIERALESLGSEYSPPPGWEDRVLAATKQSWWERLRAWQRGLIVGGPALCAALAAAVLWLGSSGAPALGRLQIASVEPEPQMMARGEDHIFPSNKELRLTVPGEGEHRALRIYRGRGPLVFACETSHPRAPGCAIFPDRLSALWTPTALDRYTVVTLVSSEPLPVTTETLDGDNAATAKLDVRETKIQID